VQILKRVLDHPLDRVFHALSDPTRRTMVERLVRAPTSVSDLAAPLDMTLAAALQHVQVLEASGVVRTEKIGRVRMCRVEPTALSAAEQWFHDRRAFWDQNLDRLEEVLREDPSKKRKKP
jgi:DNA-binding transcriptional ArsR family regulator